MKLEERTLPTESIIPARLAVYLSLSSSSQLQSSCVSKCLHHRPQPGLNIREALSRLNHLEDEE